MNIDKVYAESIAKEYAVKKDSKVVALKKLDAKIKQGPTIFTFSFGIISTLVLGVGMCLAMGVIGWRNYTYVYFKNHYRNNRNSGYLC